MSNNTEEPNEEWIQSWMKEFYKLVQEDGLDWIDKIKEWELNNPAPKPSGPIITIPKMVKQQKGE
jgi:hypothetical protein